MVNDSNIICGGDKRGAGRGREMETKSSEGSRGKKMNRRTFERSEARGEGKKGKSGGYGGSFGKVTVEYCKYRRKRRGISVLVSSAISSPRHVRERPRVGSIEDISISRALSPLSKTLGHTSGMTRSRKSELYLSKC